MIVVSDSTPIMTLLKIGKMDLLSELFGEVIIPKAVYRELTTNKDYEDEVKEVENASYFRVVDVEDDNALRLFRRATGLDDGESEAIIYSDSIHADILLIDEKKGRRVAKQMGLSIMGTIGLLMAAYKDGHIDKDEVTRCVSIMKNSGQHIGDDLYEKLLNFINDQE